MNTDLKEDISVSVAVDEMAKNDVGYVIVRDFDEHEDALAESEEERTSKRKEVAGILTAGGILKNVVVPGLEPTSTLVKEVMTPAMLVDPDDAPKDINKTLLQVESETSLLTLMRLMLGSDLRYVVVTNKKMNKIRGLVNCKDIVDALASQDFESIKLDS